MDRFLFFMSFYSVKENPSDSLHTFAHDELRKIAQKIRKNLGTIYCVDKESLFLLRIDYETRLEKAQAFTRGVR